MPGARPHRSRIPPGQAFAAPGPNGKTWEKSELRPTNVSAWRSRITFFLDPVTKRGHIRTAIYWLRMWLTRGETRMSWKHRTPEQWMRIGFTALVIVSVICTLLIVVAKLR